MIQRFTHLGVSSKSELILEQSSEFLQCPTLPCFLGVNNTLYIVGPGRILYIGVQKDKEELKVAAGQSSFQGKQDAVAEMVNNKLRHHIN